MSSPRAVLFDLDGTLYDERGFVDGGFRAVAAFVAPLAHGRGSGPSPDDLVDRLWELHGRDGRGHLFDTLLDEAGLGATPDLVATCLFVYRTHPVALVPFDGVTMLLDALRSRDIRTGLVSDGHAAVQARKLAGLAGLADRLDVALFTDLLGPGNAKPSTVPFEVACRLIGIPPAATIYVGNDPRKDFRGARAAGLGTIRFGPLPDEGGERPSASGSAEDADLAAATIDELTRTLLGAKT